jgi:hypothetical protein
MFRDERQTALNDAIEACLAAAHIHEDGAAALGEDAAWLAELGRERCEDATVLGEHLRRLGDLPKEPDPEYQAAADLISHIKAALAEDERTEVIERSRAAEEAFAAALEEVLKHELAPECRRDVERILATTTLT